MSVKAELFSTLLDSARIAPRTILRVARPTDQLAAVLRFYCLGLGLKKLDAFEDHDGFDGVMLGMPGSAYHLEFTREKNRSVGRAPTLDHLLVFYVPDKTAWFSLLARMSAMGYAPVPSHNPYWDRCGRTFEDPDGYRVVLQRGAWHEDAQVAVIESSR